MATTHPVHERADVPIESILIDPAFNIDPRRGEDPTHVDPMVASIQHHGLLEPLVVHAVTDRRSRKTAYYLLAGFVRFSALKRLGWKVVPVVVKRDLKELDAIAINGAENTVRRQVHPFYVAKRFEFLHSKHGVTYKEIADAHGYTENYVINLVTTYRRTNENIRTTVFETADVSEERIPTIAWLMANAKKTPQEQQEAYEFKYGKQRDMRKLQEADEGEPEVVEKKPKRPTMRSRDDILKLLHIQLQPDSGLEIALKGFEADKQLSKRERVLLKAALLWVLDKRKPFPFAVPAKKVDPKAEPDVG